MTSIKTDSFGNSDMTIQDAIVYAIIAIGAQCRAQKPMDRSYERFHFTRAQKFAFANMLEDPSINMVRLFLILGFYMLGACQRNAAFMYIGVAARAACVLGLHHDDAYSQVPSVERSTRYVVDLPQVIHRSCSYMIVLLSGRASEFSTCSRPRSLDGHPRQQIMVLWR